MPTKIVIQRGTLDKVYKLIKTGDIEVDDMTCENMKRMLEMCDNNPLEVWYCCMRGLLSNDEVFQDPEAVRHGLSTLLYTLIKAVKDNESSEFDEWLTSPAYGEDK